MDEQTHETEWEDDGVMSRADLLSGIVFVILGLVLVYFSWTMDRLEIRHIHPATVPGLVPGALGALLALMGAVLTLRSLAKVRLTDGWARLGRVIVSEQALRVYVAAGLALVFSLILVGRVPFWLASGLFIFAFVLVFELWLTESRRPLAHTLIWAVVLSVVVAAAVTFTFERGFLVRLP